MASNKPNNFMLPRVLLVGITLVCLGVWYMPAEGMVCLQQRGRGIGNHLFQYASMYSIVGSGNFVIYSWFQEPARVLDQAFDFSPNYVQGNYSECKNNSYYGYKYNWYNPNFHTDVLPESYTLDSYLQSWKYFHRKEKELRALFKFRPEVEMLAKTQIEGLGLPHDVTVVGVHVRRGDVLDPLYNYYGYKAASLEYVRTAMAYFMAKYFNVHFIVVSNDINWCKENLADANVHFVSTETAITDMAVLVSCDHVIITVGTFGWWAAWLANGETVYYSNWPQSGSRLSQVMNLKDYYWPGWMGM